MCQPLFGLASSEKTREKGGERALATKALFTLFKERVPLDLKVRPASEQREGIQSTLRKYSWAS